MKIVLKFLVLTILLVLATPPLAQSVIIGSGPATNSTTESSPVNIWYRKVVSHFVITAAEINAAGYTGPGTIHKLAWFVTQKPVYDIPGYRIQMKHTTATNASGVANGGWVEVRSPNTYSPTAGDWDFLTFDSPFNWDGNQNLAVRICWTQVQPTYSSSGQCRVVAQVNGYKYRWSDNSGNGCGQNPNTLSNYKPQVNLVFDTLTTWTGIVSSDWFTPGNWTAGVPDLRMDAIIPAGVPNNPNLNGIGACEELILTGTMTNSSGGELYVYSNFSNTGTWIDGGGRIVMTGNFAATFNTTPMTVTELFIENKGGTVISGGMVTIADELQVNKSTLNTGNLITIRSDASGTGRINELNASCNYTLDMIDSWGDGWNGGYLSVYEDGVEIGQYAAELSGSTETFNIASGSTMVLAYTAGSWENENSYDLVDPSGSIIFSDGPNPATGNVFTATASCAFTPLISGEITMERYIDGGATYWRYFGSAVQGATVAQYNDDFTTAGYPGSHWPAFPFCSVYTYDETLSPGLGYVECTGATQIIEQGQGLQVWCGDTITGTQPFLVDLVGVPNQGDIVLPVTYTNTGTPSEDGWNMVSNPYPSTIDWESSKWTKNNMANAVYIQNPDNQQYATYVSGASANGGSRYIASQQSFWVYATGISPVLDATEGVKADIDQAFFKSNQVLTPGLTIRFSDDLESDEAVIRHIDGATDAVEYEYDAIKMWGGWGLYPQLTVLNDLNQDLTVHSFDKGVQEWSIPLRTVVFQNGYYKLEFENVNELDVPCLILEDTYTNSNYLIEQGVPLIFEMSDTTFSPRFILHIGKNYESSVVFPLCYGQNNGSIILDLDENTDMNYTIVHNGSIENATGNANPLMIEGLDAGIYSVEIPDLLNLCNQTVFNFIVSQPAQLGVDVTIIDESFGADGSIVASGMGGTPPYNYLWSNGDTLSTILNLTADTYYLWMTDGNGCVYKQDYTVNSLVSVDKEEDQLFFYFDADQHMIQVVNWKGKSETISLISSNGSLVQIYTTSINSSQSFMIPENIAEGVYFLRGANEIYLKFVVN